MKTKIQNVTVFDGDAAVLRNTAVLFDESGILTLGREAENAPADTTVDGIGKTLLPGLIDCHVHLGMIGGMNAPQDPAMIGAKIAAEVQTVWRYGITTMRNMATAQNVDIKVRNMINDGTIPGCRILACGRGISITGGHGWPINHECDTEADVLTATREQIKAGADTIKFFATGGMSTKGSNPNAVQLTEGQMHVGVQEAENLGLLTGAHCTSLPGAANAIRAGVRSIEHARLDLPTAQLMKEYGSYWVPTIVTRYNILHTEVPAYQYMRKKADPSDLVEKKRAINLCMELGVPVAAGTDSGTGSLCPLGSSLATELGIYVEYGMTPQEALRSANRTAAEMLRLDDKIGTIAVGKAADLLLVDGDPLRNIAQIKNVSRTYQAGRLVFCAEAGLA